MNYKQKAIYDFCQTAKNLGFKCYLSTSKNYGFYTDEKRERCVYFQYDLGGLVFSGCYKANPQGGTGWRFDTQPNVINKEALRVLLKTNIPQWLKLNKVQYVTADYYLENNKHSGYVEM